MEPAVLFFEFLILSNEMVRLMISGEDALDILKQLDQRQEAVIQDLDALNQRIEALLAMYQSSRSGSSDGTCKTSPQDCNLKAERRAA